MVINFKNKADRIAHVAASVAKVEKWLTGMSDESWSSMIEGMWTAKDLVGHLAVWSDLLLDQIEALAQNTPDIIQQIDIDHWNAAQITLRSDWSIAKVRKEWEQSMMRARSLIKRLPDEIWSYRAVVPWTKEPVSLDELLNLWLLHITQHQDVWEK
jgi:hypothetical protein